MKTTTRYLLGYKEETLSSKNQGETMEIHYFGLLFAPGGRETLL
jgi:hypothetical protein